MAEGRDEALDDRAHGGEATCSMASSVQNASVPSARPWSVITRLQTPSPSTGTRVSRMAQDRSM